MRKAVHIAILLLAAALLPAKADSASLKSAFKPLCDTLHTMMRERSGVDVTVGMSKVIRKGNRLDLHFTKQLMDYPWRAGDAAWFADFIRNNFPCKGYRLGAIYINGLRPAALEMPRVPNDGHPSGCMEPVPDPAKRERFISEQGARRFAKGLDGRYIALWQSHGRYFNEKEGRWSWQRAPVFCTNEDLFTQSFVLPFLIPMLENAGAYVMTPRERDLNAYEVIADNDPAFSEDRSGSIRKKGRYRETGRWESAGTGFADAKASYRLGENPFRMGSARTAVCSDSKESAYATWSADFPQRGRYAVYISYRSLPNSSSSAVYTVSHLGGESRFTVNQKMGGGTWIYLGTFEFEGCGSVRLSNRLPAGMKSNGKAVVCADAVRFGGGMGKTLREGGDVSGLPSYAEGATYSCQWNGFSEKVYHVDDSEYKSDIKSRPLWVRDVRDSLHIPVDLSLAFHTDAGTTPNDSTVGTLSIYSLKSDNGRTTSKGIDRMYCRLLADYVQSQVVNDIRAGFNSEWARRGTSDRGYFESREGDVPAMILEILSHQNFADMSLGHDPAFRFTSARAVYKGILKFLSELYGRPYAVQPLPVRSFSVSFADSCRTLAHLCWKAVSDTLEPTASPDGYTVYTRIDGGAFDKGLDVDGTSVDLPIEKGHIYSFKVEARNDGGRSFPSETLSIYNCDRPNADVLIVNGFTRVSGPASFSSPDFAGFDVREDHGVPYIEDIHFAGEMYNFRRSDEWVSDQEAGFGATYITLAAERVAGNSFDFPYIHGKAFAGMGVSFTSCSIDSFRDTCFRSGNAGIVDLICGKQKNVFEPTTLSALERFASKGGSILVSGSETGESERADSTGTARRLLGFRWMTGHASPDGKVGDYRLYNSPNPVRYCVENPDGIAPAYPSATTVLKYGYESIPAAVFYNSGTYRVAAYGFPLECLDSEEDIKREIKSAMNYLTL